MNAKLQSRPKLAHLGYDLLVYRAASERSQEGASFFTCRTLLPLSLALRIPGCVSDHDNPQFITGVIGLATHPLIGLEHALGQMGGGTRPNHLSRLSGTGFPAFTADILFASDCRRKELNHHGTKKFHIDLHTKTAMIPALPSYLSPSFRWKPRQAAKTTSCESHMPELQRTMLRITPSPHFILPNPNSQARSESASNTDIADTNRHEVRTLEQIEEFIDARMPRSPPHLRPIIQDVQHDLYALEGVYFSSFEENRTLASRLQELFDRLGVRVLCSKDDCGQLAHSSLLKGQGAENGSFQYEHNMNGKRSHHRRSKGLPALDLGSVSGDSTSLPAGASQRAIMKATSKSR